MSLKNLISMLEGNNSVDQFDNLLSEIAFLVIENEPISGLDKIKIIMCVKNFTQRMSVEIERYTDFLKIIKDHKIKQVAVTSENANKQSQTILKVPSEQQPSTSGSVNKRGVKFISDSEKNIKKLNLTGRVIEFLLGDPDTKNLEQWLRDSFQFVLDEITRGYQSDDHMGLSISTPDQPHNPKAYISFRPLNAINADVIMNELLKIMQSNTQFFTDSPLKVDATIFKSRKSVYRNMGYP